MTDQRQVKSTEMRVLAAWLVDDDDDLEEESMYELIDRIGAARFVPGLARGRAPTEFTCTCGRRSGAVSIKHLTQGGVHSPKNGLDREAWSKQPLPLNGRTRGAGQGRRPRPWPSGPVITLTAPRPGWRGGRRSKAWPLIGRPSSKPRRETVAGAQRSIHHSIDRPHPVSRRRPLRGAWLNPMVGPRVLGPPCFDDR